MMFAQVIVFHAFTHRKIKCSHSSVAKFPEDRFSLFENENVSRPLVQVMSDPSLVKS